MLRMYAASSSAMHQLFFPPRLQVVALQQNPNGLATHLGNQFAFDGLFRDQADRPARPAHRRVTAHHGDDPLFLGIIQNLAGSRALFVIEGALEPATVIAMGDLADGLRGERESLRHAGCGGATGQLL